MAKTKRLNKNLIMVLTAFGFLLTTAAGIAMVFFLQETNPDRFEELGREAEKNEDWAGAAQYYTRAWGISEDPRFLVLVGDTHYARGQEDWAMRFWAKAVEVDPRLQAGHEKLLDLLLEYTRLAPVPATWVRVKKAAEGLLDIDAKNPKGLYGMGAALIELRGLDEGDEEKGLETLKEAIEIAPEEVEYARSLADYYVSKAAEHRRNNEPDKVEAALDEAEKVLKRVIAMNPEPGGPAAQARSEYAALLVRRGRIDEALDWFAKAAEFAGDDAEAKSDVLSAHAQYWVQKWLTSRVLPNQEVDEDAARQARQLCEEAIQVNPDAFTPYLLLSELYRAEDRLADAAQVCEQRLARPIVRKGAKRIRQKRLRYMLLIKAAELYAGVGLGHDAGSPEREEAFSSAMAKIQDAAAEEPNLPQTLETEALVRHAQGDAREAMRLCEEADRAYGDRVSWRNKLRLASLRYDTGEIGAAKDAIEKAIQQPLASATCWSLYARILLELEETPRALLAADQALERAPGDLSSLRIKARALAKLGREVEANRVLQQIDQAGGEAILVQAHSLLSENRVGDALALLRDQLAKDPGNERYAVVMARILRRVDRADEAAEVLRQAVEANPESMRLQNMLAQVDTTKTPEERDASVLKQIQAVEDVFRRELQLAEYYSRRGDSDQAEAHLVEAQRLFLEKGSPEARAANPGTLQDILSERLALALDDEDWDRAEKITAKAIEDNTDGADGLTYLGRLHLAKGNPAEAAQAFKGALEKQPTNSRTLLLLGEAYLTLQQYSEAKSAFERATDINPMDGLAWKGQALIAYREGDEARLATLIERCQKLIPSDRWIQEQATILQEIDEPTTGIERREKILEQNPDDLRNLVRLASLYQRTEQNDKAEELFRRALAKEPTERNLAWTAAGFFSATGRTEEGLKILQELVRSTEDPARKAEAQLLIGAFFADRNDVARADAAYLAAADIQLTLNVAVKLGSHYFHTNRVRKAIEWLEKAIAIADREGSPQSARVRRMEVECYLTLRQKDKAKERYEQYAERYADDVDGLRLRAEVELLYGQPDKAIVTLTRYLEQRPSDPRILYRRAQIFGSLQQWRRACADLEELRAVDPAALDYRPRILLSIGYDKTDRTLLAENELKSVLEQDPEADSIAYELIRFYQKYERYLDAEKIVVARLARAPDSPQWLRVAGDIAAKLQDQDKALKLYRQAAQNSGYRPRFVAPYLDAQIQFKTFQEGITFYENELPADRRSPAVIYRYAHLLAQAGKVDLAKRNYLLAIDLAGIGSTRFLELITRDAVTALGRDRALELFQAEPDDERLKRPAKQLTAVLLEGLGSVEGAQRYEESLEAVDSLIATTQDDRENAALLVQKARLLVNLSNLEKAREVYEAALNLNPNDVVALNNLAYLLSDKLGAPQQALPYALKAAELDESAEILDTLGWVYVRLGRFGDAISELTRAVQQEPDYIPGLAHLGEAHRRAGSFANAENVLTSALDLVKTGRFDQYAEFKEEAEVSLQKTRDKQSGP